jgi:opacity protein-like surface antigen
MKNRLIPLAAFAAFSALPAAAQQSPWYAGLSFGGSKTDSAIVANREATITNAFNISTSFDDKDTAWKGLVGYRFNDIIALEASYSDYGSTRMETTFLTEGGPNNAGLPGGVTSHRDIQAFGVDLVVSAPVWERFTVFGRVGYARADVSTDAQLTGNVFFNDGTEGSFRSNNRKENVARYGVGMVWNFMPNVTARLEWERLADVGHPYGAGESNATGEADQDTWFLGLNWRL